MRVLLTGAFGNIGTSAREELLAQGHTVRCFDLKRKASVRAARRLQGRAEVVWGDLRRKEDVAAAVRGQDVVVHLAFIIPKLSATGVESEDHPDWSREINVGGTRNLLEAMKAQPHPPKLVFISSYHVFGLTHDRTPPLKASDPVSPVEHYARHKVECEQMVCDSGLEYTILRLAAAFPITMLMDPGMFDIPLENRMEFVHTRDVGRAIANAVSSPDVWGKLLLVGGGSRCQYYYREIVSRTLEAMGVGMLPEEAFSARPFATDWIDSSETEALLHYQQRDLGDYLQEMQRRLGVKRLLVRLCRPLVRMWLLNQSPSYRKHLAHTDRWSWLWLWQRMLRQGR
ncbi:MAG: NAD(P)-dependent oxidoreductase [Chloroflexi bacterium]|nr:NAD(P)-dependent oxidoreductase [Chloroflexota bacterium]